MFLNIARGIICYRKIVYNYRGKFKENRSFFSISSTHNKAVYNVGVAHCTSSCIVSEAAPLSIAILRRLSAASIMDPSTCRQLAHRISIQRLFTCRCRPKHTSAVLSPRVILAFNKNCVVCKHNYLVGGTEPIGL